MEDFIWTDNIMFHQFLLKECMSIYGRTIAQKDTDALLGCEHRTLIQKRHVSTVYDAMQQ